MTLTPVSSGRVPFSIQSQMAISNITRRQKELTDVATELSTGEDFAFPATILPTPSGRASCNERKNSSFSSATIFNRERHLYRLLRTASRISPTRWTPPRVSRLAWSMGPRRKRITRRPKSRLIQ